MRSFVLVISGCHNIKERILATPQSIFTTSNLSLFKNNSIQAIVLLFPSFHTAIAVDLDTLYQDILLALLSNSIATKHISVDDWWSMNPNSLLLLNNRIYVLFASNLHICILQYNHDHILAKYFGQNKILELVCYGYSWPSLYTDV